MGTIYPPGNRVSGFTLIEILIVIGIAGLIALFLYETFISSARVTEKIDRERDRYREIRLTADQLSRELLSAYQSHISSTPLDFLGEHLTGSDGAMDSLTFYTLSRLHLIPNQADADLTRVRYFLEKPAGGKWYRLSHEEYPHFLSNGLPEKEVLVEQVKELDFEYFDGKTWQTEWNAGKSAGFSIPAAVRMRLVVVDSNGEQEEWVHQVDLMELSTG